MSGANAATRSASVGMVDVADMAVDQQAFVPRRLQQGPAIAEFQREMRLAAAEVDGRVERPARVDEGDFHSAASAARPRLGAFAPQPIGETRQALAPRRRGAARPSASMARLVSET